MVMKYIINESQYNFLIEVEQEDPPINRIVLKLFRFLNQHKKLSKTKGQLLKAVKEYLPFFGIPENKASFILELYLLNYRPDGDYSNLTKDNFVDPRNVEGKRTSNWEARNYTASQLPFKGSNLEGYWKQTPSGKIYVVKSYGWYSVFIFKDGIWYEIKDRYSRATGKQMSNANPYVYDRTLGTQVYLLDRNEMDRLERGATHEEIMNYKKERFKNVIPALTSDKFETLRFRVPQSGKIKYKISSVEESDDTFIINVDIHEVDGAIKGAGPDAVENKLESTIRQNLEGYLAGKIMGTPDKETIVIKFNHLEK